MKENKKENTVTDNNDVSISISLSEDKLITKVGNTTITQTKDKTSFDSKTK